MSVSFSPDGKRIVSGSRDESIIIWDAESGNQLKTLNGHSSYVIFLNIFFNFKLVCFFECYCFFLYY